MVNTREKQLSIMQENLAPLRKIAGWTAEDLGNEIGVTKQTISNLENHRSKLSLTQYIAIRAVLENESRVNDNELLGRVIILLLDKGADFSEVQYAETTEKVETIAAAISTKTLSKAGIASLSGALLGGILPVLPFVGSAALWLTKLRDSKKK